jgi:bifunctional non-homologous end joining protein LigD
MDSEINKMRQQKITTVMLRAAYAGQRCPVGSGIPFVGWAERQEKRFDGRYLGRMGCGGLVYAGKLERGFSEQDKRDIVKRLTPLRMRKQLVIAARKSFPKARWVKPLVLVDAEFRGKTGEGLLRHPAFKGVREDLEREI